MPDPTNDYVLGRGKLYFDKFTDLETMALSGERYLGNTPSLNMTSTYQNLDHYSSDYGLREKDDSVTLQLDRAGNFTCDNITMENVALVFGTEPVTETQTPTTATAENLIVKRGMYYQLGTSAAVPDGVGTISNLLVADDAAVAIPAAANWEADLQRGRLHILENAAVILDGDTIEATYDTAGGTTQLVIDEGTEVEGALRFIADNPKGTNKNYYWPRVKLTASGDYALKGDTWQTMTFNFDVLSKSGLKRVYVREMAD